jgi:uncharacterized protein YecE (DUF72 family)
MVRSCGRALVGCSGWQYRDWRGVVYPDELPMRRWFEHYATRFSTVELNSTFYRLPSVETVERWREQAPAGFIYAVKLGAFGSHRMKLRDARSWLPNHVDRVERLGGSAGPTLVQLPPHWRRNTSRLDEFLDAAGRAQRWAIELREPSWLHDGVFDVLQRHQAALCIHDLLPRHPWIETADWSYVRMHGPDATDAPYQGRYGPRRLHHVVDRVGPWLEQGHDSYVYFNNDHQGHAAADAAWLSERLGERTRG